MTSCLIAIVWANNVDNPQDTTFGFLAYGGGGGPVRVFHRDQYDARCDLGRDRAKDGPLPYFKNWLDAVRFFATHPDKTTCQVALPALRRAFPGDADFAEVATDRQCDVDSPSYNIGSAL